jgi:hypothetical protein
MAETPTKAELSPTLRTFDQRLAIMAAGERRGLWKYVALVDGRYLINRAQPGEPDDYHTLDGSQVDKIPFTFFVEPIAAQGEQAWPQPPTRPS